MELTRRNFLKTAGVVAIAPLAGVGLVEKLAGDVAVVTPFDIWDGIEVRYLGRGDVLQPIKWDEDGKPTDFDEYQAHRYHLSRRVVGRGICEAYADIDAGLMDCCPVNKRVGCIKDELAMYAEAIQERVSQG